MNKLANIILLTAILISAAGCTTGSENIDEVTGVNSDTLKVNKFIVDLSSILYLWEDQVDWTKFENTYKTYKDPYQLLNDIRYKDDKWSMLTDDIESLQGEFAGVNTSFGWELIRGRFSNDNSYFYIVLYVYPGSPAYNKGIKRGDIIITIDGEKITDANYLNAYYASNITVTRGYIKDDAIHGDNTPVSLTAVIGYNNSILKDTILVRGTNKIGYLAYAAFTELSEPDLIRVFSGFKSAGVNDVVLDLRYNPGGYVRTSLILSSILAPASAVKSKSVYQIQKWNKYYAEKYNSQTLFTDTLPVNMNLNRLYVLATNFSASASEATIIALEPYMDVVILGDTTSGKFVGGSLFSPEDIYENADYYRSIKDWGMYLMLFRYTNKNETYYVSGLPPDVRIDEDYFDLKQFGDPTDPLLGKALERITGVKYSETRSSSDRFKDYILLPDKNHRKLPDGWLISPLPEDISPLNPVR